MLTQLTMSQNDLAERSLGSFTKLLPSFANDCAATTLIGLGGTLKVAFVRKARLTLFHFESCCCIFGAGVTASSIVEYWKQTSHSTRHGTATSVTTVWQEKASPRNSEGTLFTALFSS